MVCKRSIMCTWCLPCVWCHCTCVNVCLVFIPAANVYMCAWSVMMQNMCTCVPHGRLLSLCSHIACCLHCDRNGRLLSVCSYMAGCLQCHTHSSFLSLWSISITIFQMRPVLLWELIFNLGLQRDQWWNGEDIHMSVIETPDLTQWYISL